jgi:Leucine Rich Repeat (LRR) protein
VCLLQSDGGVLDIDANSKEVFAMLGASTHDEPQSQTVISDQSSWRRKVPLRVSVRSLMIFVLMLGGVLGWVVHLAHVQRDAVAAIRSGGGNVTYDWQLKRLPNGNARFDPKGRPKAPKWLLEYLGPDYFGHVEEIALGPRNTDVVMKQIGQLDKLRRIRFFTGIDLAPVASAGLQSLPNVGLSRFEGLFRLMTTDLSPQFNGANFKYLKNMTRLEYFNVPVDSAVTDADLPYLSKLTALSQLELHDSRITDVGLVSLKDMTRLKHLRLAGTQVTGAGLRSLRAMPGLKFLDLGRTRVDDLSPIGHLTLLTDLHLSQTPIDDNGLAPIAGLIGLDELRLDSTNVTSVSYGYLKHLSKLKGLSLHNTQVGDEGSAALADLTALSRLQLDDTRITDVTLAHLAGMSKLKALSLARTQITDRGLATLTECKALRRLNVRGTRISRDGVRAFQMARPYVVVVR